MSNDVSAAESGDLSLVLGGRSFNFYGAHLSGIGLELLVRCVIVMALLVWLSLLVESPNKAHALISELYDTGKRTLLPRPYRIHIRAWRPFVFSSELRNRLGEGDSFRDLKF